MDFDFDLDDLGDLGDLDENLSNCDWDNLVAADSRENSQSSQQQSEQQQQQQIQQQQQQQQQQAQTIPNNGLYPPNENNDQYQNGADSFITPGNNHPHSPVDPDIPTPQISNNTNEAFQIRLDREREGRCADCGAQTHEVQFDPSGSGRSIKVPLSVPGEVHRGRCLFCHPLPTSHSRKRVDSQQQRSSSRHGYGEENQLDQHLNNNQPQGQPYQNSSASVCTASSQQSSQSIYSHQSAPVWGGGQQQQQQDPQQFQQNSNADLAENYQQQQYMQQQMQLQMQQQLQQQQQQFPNLQDDGSVYSQATHESHHSIHSQASYQSQASYHSYNQQLSSPQLNPANVETQFLRSGSANNSASIGPNDNDAAQAIFIQMQHNESSLDTDQCLQAMQSFPAHSPIQEKGCAILWAQSNNADVCQALANMGGASIILDAMRNHPHHPNIQLPGCESLRNMCVHPLNLQLILQSGGVPLLVVMMRNHVNNPEIQSSGCTTLATVAKGGMEAKISVAESGGILAVMKAVEIHPENDLVLRAAYQALRMLGYNPGAK